MSISFDQILLDVQRIANRVKDLEALGNTLLIEAEGNNRQIETIKQFQGDVDSLNKLARNKSNTEMVNNVNLYNSNLKVLQQKNRELESQIEDQQRGLELIMHKYRQQIQHKIFSSNINFREVYNAKLQEVIRKQQEKINEMAAVMQKAASIDDDVINNEIELIHRLKVENETLREMLQISKQFKTDRIGCENKAIQTEININAEASDINNHLNNIENNENHFDKNDSIENGNDETVIEKDISRSKKDTNKNDTIIKKSISSNPSKSTLKPTSPSSKPSSVSDIPATTPSETTVSEPMITNNENHGVENDVEVVT